MRRVLTVCTPMFNQLSQRFSSIIDRFQGKKFVSEQDVEKALRDVRVALLESDVALSLATTFMENVQKKAVGEQIHKKSNASEALAKWIFDELVAQLSSEDTDMILPGKKPDVVLMAGLQGSGKTTTTAKLAYQLQKDGKKVLMASTDIYRPAAKEQLKQLGETNAIDTLAIIEDEATLATCKRALDQGKNYDVVIIDTAGRLHIDQSLMDEIQSIKKLVKPSEILLVADALTGQDAVQIAKSFHDALQITGIVLTRVDGDGRGGTALSMKAITGCPIKWMGVGEKIDQFEKFDAERIAYRILDMGDFMGLVERAQVVSDKEAEDMEARMAKGLFDLNDMANYLTSMNKMGGLSALMQMMPGIGRAGDLSSQGVDDRLLKRQVAMIQAMTPKERRQYQLLTGSRKKRIAAGAGVDSSDVSKLIRQFEQVKAMMENMGILGGKGISGGMLDGLKNMLF